MELLLASFNQAGYPIPLQRITEFHQFGYTDKLTLVKDIQELQALGLLREPLYQIFQITNLGKFWLSFLEKKEAYTSIQLLQISLWSEKKTIQIKCHRSLLLKKCRQLNQIIEAKQVPEIISTALQIKAILKLLSDAIEKTQNIRFLLFRLSLYADLQGFSQKIYEFIHAALFISLLS